MDVGFVLFPRLTQLDFTGPLQVLSRLPDATTHLVAASLAPVPTDAVMTINPTISFADCPQLDVICVPGGFGTVEAVADAALVKFVRDQAAAAKYVTSVCTGSFILGAAGLLEGKKATTHWAYHDELARVGAVPTKARVVRDGNIFTGGGVTAGVDFALPLAAEMFGDDLAQSIQLGIEYDPHPPFEAGSPDRAPAAIRDRLSELYGARVKELTDSLDAAAARG